jgi:hypothetical protein
MSIVLPLLALTLAVQVEGNGQCPTPAQVREQLRPLLPRELRSSNAHRARMTRNGKGLSLELRERGGVLLAHRSFHMDRAQSCSEQARQVAVILAAWEVRLQAGDLAAPDLHEVAAPLAPEGAATVPLEAAPTTEVLPPAPPQVTPAPPAPEAPPPPQPQATPEPVAPPLAPAEAPQPLPSAPPPEAVVEAAVEAPKEPAAPSPLTLDLGAGALASLTGGQLAFGGLAQVVLGGQRSRWIGVLSLTAVGNHSLKLDPGTALWSRFALSAGPGLRLRFGAFALEPYVLAAIALLHLRGEGFTNTAAVNGYDVALGAGLRFSVSWHRLRPFLAATVSDWISGPKVALHGTDETTSLPNVEFLLELGLSFELL